MEWPEAKKDETKEAEQTKEPKEEKKKEWYDKVSLRGYAQFRYNYLTHLEEDSARPQYVGDSSIGDDQE